MTASCGRAIQDDLDLLVLVQQERNRLPRKLRNSPSTREAHDRRV
jgi:hypothetical protein